MECESIAREDKKRIPLIQTNFLGLGFILLVSSTKDKDLHNRPLAGSLLHSRQQRLSVRSSKGDEEIKRSVTERNI